MNHNEKLNALALTCIPGLGTTTANLLVSTLGSATEVFNHRQELPMLIPGASEKLIHLLDCPEAFHRAEEELAYAKKQGIQCLTLRDEAYPLRLKECPDAPLALFYKGNVPLNALHVISVIGTRHATPYGKDLCDRFLADLAQRVPDVLIVSGLAYGIDIQAHRSALNVGLSTIGVLAHGLDRIYPSLHRDTANRMTQQGGLLTEFMTGTNPDRQNFIMRNRIVAGMADATIVIESAAKGGALITAELAGSYHRDCFAFPGRCTDEFSMGCNELIRTHRASILLSADNLVEALGWQSKTKREAKIIQRDLFPDISPSEQCIVDVLQGYEEGLQINTLVVKTNLPIHQMSALLFELEMKGMVKVMAGGVYRLIR